MYRDKGWRIAEVRTHCCYYINVFLLLSLFLSGKDYTNFSCGRLCFSLHSPEEAHNAIECLLSHESYQSIQQQLSNVRDFIFVKRVSQQHIVYCYRLY